MNTHDAHDVDQLTRGRPLELNEIRCLIADHQTPIRHGTASPIYEAAEILLRRLDDVNSAAAAPAAEADEAREFAARAASFARTGPDDATVPFALVSIALSLAAAPVADEAGLREAAQAEANDVFTRVQRAVLSNDREQLRALFREQSGALARAAPAEVTGLDEAVKSLPVCCHQSCHHDAGLHAMCQCGAYVSDAVLALLRGNPEEPPKGTER